MPDNNTTAGTSPARSVNIGSVQTELVAIADLKLYPGNPRVHSKRQLKQLTASIAEFGFLVPIVTWDDNEVVTGHARIEAAKALGMTELPTVRASHLAVDQIKAFRIADNRLAEKASWDIELLGAELQGLADLDFTVELTGFDTAEIDQVLQDAEAMKTKAATGLAERIPAAQPVAVTQLGDVWTLGRHRLICGDSTKAETYADLMQGGQADMVFTDAPYNVAIEGFVSGSGAHREFIMGAGEMSKAQFRTFLEEAHREMAFVCKDGAIIHSCMDWRSIHLLIQVGETLEFELKNLVVWRKSNAGQGSFYRSQHELIAVFKVGSAPHTNTFGLGETGRYRTNVWDYAGANTFSKSRKSDLAMHPTVKPVALVSDAILDVTHRGEVVLDPFGGSGTTLIAAQKVGRIARLIELDPIYCDVIVRRWQAFTGQKAIRAADGVAFEDVEMPSSAMEMA